MSKRFSLFKFSSHRRKLCEKIKTHNRKPWRIAYIRTCTMLTVFSLLLSFCGSVGADYVMPAPPQKIVITETHISTPLTIPANTVFINVTEYDAMQIVKNITVEFSEPVTYVGFALDVLSGDPSYVGTWRNKTLPYSNETILQYYLVRFLTDYADKITNVTIVFAVEKAAAQERDEEITLTLYRYDGRKMEECPTEKFEEDDAFLYFKTTTGGSAYVAITRVLMPTPWWLVVVIIAMIALMVVIGIYGYRRFKLANQRKMVKT